MVEFRSRYNTYVTSVTIDGKQIPVEFTSIRHGGSYFSTDSKKVAAELKKHNAEYCYVYREDIVEEVKDEVEVEDEAEEAALETIVESVKNISEAKEYLRGLGIAFQKLNTPENIKAWAKKKNVIFPNLK
jgi:glutaredoxin 2